MQILPDNSFYCINTCKSLSREISFALCNMSLSCGHCGGETCSCAFTLPEMKTAIYLDRVVNATQESNSVQSNDGTPWRHVISLKWLSESNRTEWNGPLQTMHHFSCKGNLKLYIMQSCAANMESV